MVIISYILNTMSIGDIPEKASLNRPEQKEKIDLRILVAEDSPDIRMIFETLLRRKYSSVESVEDGQLLLKKLSTPNYNVDFIITDNSMPNMTGIDAIERIRNLGIKIPIIMCTTDYTGELEPQTGRLNFTILSKPVNANTLYAMIEKLRLEKSNPQT